MSGGSYCYMFNRIEEEYVGRMFDSQLNSMMKDLVDVLHDLEWWQSCDSSEERYRDTVRKFKKKWFRQTKIDVQKQIESEFERTKNELLKEFEYLEEMMKVFLVENINDIHDEFVREACARLDRKIWDLIGFSTRFISMESCLEQITNYIVKLERENLGLKEYKKHQERANERRYRSGEESWHRGSVVAKKK